MNLATINTLVNSQDLVQLQLNIPFGNTLQKGNLTPHQIAKQIIENLNIPTNWKINGYGSSGLCNGICITLRKNVEIVDLRNKTKIFIYNNGQYQEYKIKL